jgi:hypothetical protein
MSKLVTKWRVLTCVAGRVRPSRRRRCPLPVFRIATSHKCMRDRLQTAAAAA